MKKELLKECIDTGNEIEFKYEGIEYSITYTIVNGKEMISFCEFYKDSTEVETLEELLKISINGHTVLEMWESLTDEDEWIIS